VPIGQFNRRDDLFAKFGLTVDAIVPQIMNKLNG
jgi:hypothetical protein